MPRTVLLRRLRRFAGYLHGNRSAWRHLSRGHMNRLVAKSIVRMIEEIEEQGIEPEPESIGSVLEGLPVDVRAGRNPRRGRAAM